MTKEIKLKNKKSLINQFYNLDKDFVRLYIRLYTENNQYIQTS